ncbi:hypothetical protein F-S17_0171 [Faustovirus]|nr:hypothetical protein F-LCD7_0185 [Faustovirus]QJX71949.1 hypothetical protein F-M6_0186 [Faustovirus]QJX72437.1 hypothetical protein F-S17_0171 [Faustovirus]
MIPWPIVPNNNDQSDSILVYKFELYNHINYCYR